MDNDQKEMFAKLIEVIGNHSNWNGRTNRELRDQVANGAFEVSSLKNEIENSTNTLSTNIIDLTEAINRQSASNNKVSRWMVALTFVLAAATVVLAIAAFSAKP